MKVQRLCGDVPLIVIQGQHAVVFPLRGLVENRVRRNGAGYPEPGFFRFLDGGGDDRFLLRPEEAVFPAMRIQSSYGHVGIGDVELSQIAVAQTHRMYDSLVGNVLRNISEGNVAGQEKNPKGAHDEKRHGFPDAGLAA